jgi:O-antigen/teichoic acid export membrane protein
MSRTKSFFNGALFAYIYQAGAMALGLWLTPFYIRSLGPQDYGIWLISMQVLTFLLLCDFGILAVAPRDFARAHGLEQSETGSGQLRVLIGQTSKVVLVQTGMIALVSLGVFLFRPTHSVGLKGPLALVLAVFVSTYPMRLFPAVLQGLQDLKFVGQLRLWTWAASTTLAVVLLLLGARFYALACGWCLQAIMHDLIAAVRLRRVRPDLLTPDLWRRAGPLKWSWFSRGFWVSLSQLAYSLVAGADLLIVGRALGPSTVVVYSCTSKLITILQNQPQVLAAAALPGLSQMKWSESHERILQATTSLTQAMLLLSGAVFCIILTVNQQFVTVWLGPRFFGGMQLTALLLLNFLCRQMDYTIAIALFAFGYEKLMAVRCLAEGIMSVVLATLLVGQFGLAGIALGFLCGTALIAIPIDVFLFTRELKISFFQMMRPYLAYIWRVALVGCMGLAIKSRLEPQSLVFVVAIAVVIGLVYLVTVFPYVWRTPLRAYIQTAVTAVFPSVGSRIVS